MGLEFDEELQKAMEMAYLTPDILMAPAEVVKQLNVRVSKSVLDIGSFTLGRNALNASDIEGWQSGLERLGKPMTIFLYQPIPLRS